MAAKRETQFRNSVVVPFLKKLKHTWFTSVQQVAIRGTPDILLCSNGRFIALELKSIGGTVSKLQEHTLMGIEKAGGFSLIASPENWEVVKHFLTQQDGVKYGQN